MTQIHLCPLSRLPDVLAQSGAGWCVSLLTTADPVPSLDTLPDDRRLRLTFADISAVRPDYALAEPSQVEALLGFLRRWDQQSPLLIHCYAGVSRSTAAAFVALCALDPLTSEHDHARCLRAASPTATPNPHVVDLADRALGREGRMRAAVAAIGRGRTCFEGVCCSLTLPNLPRRVDASVALSA